MFDLASLNTFMLIHILNPYQILYIYMYICTIFIPIVGCLSIEI